MQEQRWRHGTTVVAVVTVVVIVVVVIVVVVVVAVAVVVVVVGVVVVVVAALVLELKQGGSLTFSWQRLPSNRTSASNSTKTNITTPWWLIVRSNQLVSWVITTQFRGLININQFPGLNYRYKLQSNL